MPDEPHEAAANRAAWRIAIASGGVAGLSLAQALGSALEVAVYDPALARHPAGDRRAYAIAAGARRMLAALGIWGAIEGGAQPILDMVITDSRVSDPVRPVFLTFDGEVEPREPFAHMVESGALAAALIDACRAAAVDLRPTAVGGYEAGDEAVSLRLAGGGSAHAHLLVAADGA